MKNNGIFKAIIDSQAQEKVAANNMREAIVESIIYTTSVKQRVDEEYYDNMIKTAKRLIKAKTIVLRVGKSEDTFSFYEGSKILKSLQKLMMRLMELDCWYEDTDGYEQDGSKNFGFCWKYTINGHSTHCGLYAADDAATEEETADTVEFNCEGEECEW